MKNIFLFSILGVMFLLLIGSAWNESAIMDELAHIPAGYGYVTQLDYRLNPEHPPLIKVLSGLSDYIFVHPNFPTNIQSWTNDINGQWTQGHVFLYESGNDADRIIFWARLPIMLLTLLFGFLLFRWTDRVLGILPACITLLLYAFSPTVLAHGRYVTTDIGAAFGFFIGITSFLAFLERPTWWRTCIAGILFGIAQLCKFSLVLLIPMYAIILILWIITNHVSSLQECGKIFIHLAGKILAMGFIGLGVVWVAYTPLVWNYPQERQFRDAQFILQSYPIRPLANLDLTLINHAPTRGLGEYMLGFIMVSQRASGGNTGFFLGTVSNKGSRLYFPLLYILKEPLALQILSLIAIASAIKRLLRARRERLKDWIRAHSGECAAFTVIAVYWATSLASPLNIGIRHVLPTFPFIYILIAQGISAWIWKVQNPNPHTIFEWFTTTWRVYIKVIPKYFIVFLLMVWLVIDAFISYPNFLAYYNELAGGTENGWNVAVDSNYDWGQDLKRLTDFVQKNNIEKISLDYFGGGDPKYYLGEKFIPWTSTKGQTHGWFAISATFRQGTFGITAPGFMRAPEDSYDWLKQFKPTARVGSIFVYNLP